MQILENIKRSIEERGDKYERKTQDATHHPVVETLW